MFNNVVELGRRVDPKELETILIRAAKDMKWRAKVRPRYSTSYKLGPFDTIRRAIGKDIYLRGSFLRLMELGIGNEPNNCFYLYKGLMYGVALEFEVKKYLKRVSDYISKVSVQIKHV